MAALVIGVGSFFLGSTKTSESSTLYRVQKGNISAVVRTTGRLEPLRQAKLAFRANDVVKRIAVKPGDFVPVGTLLMELDTAQLEKQLTQAQAQRDISLFNLAAQAQKSTTITPTIAELYASARQSELAEAQLTTAKAALENASIYAPFDGTLLSVEVAEGDSVGYGQAIATFADLRQLQVRAEIDEIDVANVAAGQSVQFTLDAFPGKNFEGQVALLSPAPAQRQGSTTYPALINFKRTEDLFLRPGMAANVTITSFSRLGVLLIPNRTLETIGARKYVTKLRSDGNFEKIPVEIGLTNPDQSEIISGLVDGDQISLPR